MYDRKSQISLDTKGKRGSKPRLLWLEPILKEVKALAQKQNIDSIEADLAASNALRKLLRLLSDHGITYGAVSSSIDPQWEWNGNAIKQLVVRRDSKVRRSSKNSALIRAIEHLLTTNSDAIPPTPMISETVEQMKTLLNAESQPETSDVDKATKSLGQRFQSIRKASTMFEYPNRAAFVRWDWERRRLITVLIDTRKGSNGHVFVMKISGQKSRRIVIGDVLVTLRNTYFSGLAYEVSQEMDYQSFVDLDAFNRSVFREVTGPNEIGLECLTISNEYLHLRTAPVTFHGLDSKGNPISGLGAFIKATNFAKLGIGEEDFSSVECSKRNEPLTDLMRKFAAITVGPTSEEQFTARSEVTKILDHSYDGWAYLRSDEEGNTGVYFPQSVELH